MRVIIIGNSAAGLSGLEAFRKLDQSSHVSVVAQESTIPYSKVLLPYYLRGKISYENLFIRDPDYFDKLGATCIQGRVSKVDAQQQQVLLEDGTVLPYDKLLIATGSSPITPAIPGLAGKGIYTLWTLADCTRLVTHFKKGNRVAVLGSGFVSLQGACAALSRELSVSVIELMGRIMPRSLDDTGAALLSSQMKSKGVDLRINTTTARVERSREGGFILHFKDGGHLETDFIIVGTGVRPNIDFLDGTGIKFDAGILVDPRMETSLPGIYAAGDVAQVPSFTGGDPVVHALWPTAVETGRIAGNCMASGNTFYRGSLNMNVTQMFDLTVASMGEFTREKGCEVWIDESLEKDQYLKIVLQDGVPVGATCIGSSDLVSTLGMLRPLIREKVAIAGNPDMLKSILARNISQHLKAFVK